MELLRFLFKYYLFRSTRKVENIERVIRSHGYKIYKFHPAETTTTSAEIIRLLGATEYARTKQAFIAANDIVKGVFIRTCLSEEDRVTLFFHEEAHIWNEHLYKTGHLNNSPIQKEQEANLFLFKLRMLKAVIYAVPLLTLFCWYLLSM